MQKGGNNQRASVGLPAPDSHQPGSADAGAKGARGEGY